MLAVVPQPTFRSLPLRAPDRRARRCTEPSLGADRPSPEHKPAAAPRLLSRTRPRGEVVPRAQARVVQREVRDRRITARGVKPNALALLGRSCPPTTPHRFLLVGGSRRCVMTSITWIGITARAINIGSTVRWQAYRPTWLIKFSSQLLCKKTFMRPAY